MAKHFPNNQAKAAAYAAMKDLERMLKEDGELPPGFSTNLSGVTVEIKIPQGTTVYREKGINGDGIIEKMATQNLYGWAILHECFRFVRKFKQHKILEKSLMKIVRRAIRKAISTERAFREIAPNEAKQINDLRDAMRMPKRPEQTPRMIGRNEDKPLPTVVVKKAA